MVPTMEPKLQNPQDIRQRLWTELGRAAQDRHHAWRTPVLTTVSQSGLPNARTVVLRHADAKLTQLHFYTDARSPKVAELHDQANAMLLFWSKRLNWQLRVRARMEIHRSGPLIDAVWQRVSQSAAAGDYLAAHAPGSIASVDGASGKDATQKHHLAVLIAQVQEIDWLELDRAGHRRAKLSADAWNWLTP